MQAGSVYRVRTVAATQFTAAQAQNVGVAVTLPLMTPPKTTTGDFAALGAGAHVRSRLREIRIVSKENLAWEVALFGTSTIGGATIGSEIYLGYHAFIATDGVQATGDTFYYYATTVVNGISIQDLANLGQIYLRLINRSAAGKSAGAAGAIEVELALEVLQGR